MAKNRGFLIGCGAVAGVVVILALILFFWGKGIYNNMITLEEGVNESWSQVENVYQRRADLIPNLVETVKGVAEFERGTFTAVTEARSKVNQINVSPQMLENPQLFSQFQSAQGELGSALSRLLVTVENYPQLKANENFLQLQAQLEGTENRIAVERRRFNVTVRGYNTTIKTFPNVMFANIFNFNEKVYFQAAEGADQAPQVEF